MKVFISGGTGFIGSRLALKYLDQGDSVTVFGLENTPVEIRNRKIVEERGAEVVLGSVTETDRLPEVLEGSDVVFHLAAVQHEMHVPDQKFQDVNVHGTRNILEASVKAGVKRFVHGSTIGVYGSLQGMIDEYTPCHPDNIYGTTKLEGERVVLSYRDRLPVVVIRISEVYGPGDNRLLKLFKAIDKQMFFHIGKGQNLHHPIYIDDLVEGFMLAAKQDQAIGDVWLLAGKEPVTTNEMVAMIAEQLGKRPPTFRMPLGPFWLLATLLEKTLRPVGVQPPLHRRRMDFFKKSFTLSAKKASQGFGFMPRVPFRKGAGATAQWYKDMGYI